MTTKVSMPIERRRSPRIDFHLSVMIRGQQGLRQIRNFGIYGVFIQTENSSQFKGGGKIYLAMKLPGEKNVMEAKARIAHISPKGVGVEFVDLAREDVRSVKHCFDFFKHTVPMPGTY